jgi:hypothetical protein
MNLGWCNSMSQKGSVIHEFGHALGMNHEQKRPDAQAQYFGHGPALTMRWQNVPRDWVPQYLPDQRDYVGSKAEGEADPVKGWSPYDFGSIMHYPGGNRLDTNPASDERKLGNRRVLSEHDINQINDVYKCIRRDGSGGAPATGGGNPPPPPPNGGGSCMDSTWENTRGYRCTGGPQEGFNANTGWCQTYGTDAGDAQFKDSNGVTAMQACSGCGQCTSGGGPPPPPPPPPPTPNPKPSTTPKPTE